MSERLSGARAAIPRYGHVLMRSHTLSVTLSIQLREPERFQIDPIDGPHVHRHTPSDFDLMLTTFGYLDFVHNWDTTGRTEGVPGYFARESVDGEMVFASELDVFFQRVDPEIGVLFMMCMD